MNCAGVGLDGWGGEGEGSRDIVLNVTDSCSPRSMVIGLS